MSVKEFDQKVYRAILAYKSAHGGNAPSYRKIAELLGEGSRQSAHRAVQRLVDEGLITVVDGEICLVGEQYVSPERTDLQ